MKKSLLLLALLAILALVIWVCVQAGSGKGPRAMVRIYFAGTNSICSDTNSAAFEDEFGCPEARALESQTLDKLSRAPGVWFINQLPPGADDGSAQLRPLLDDFLKSEWIFEMRPAPAAPEYALAIRLDDNRAQLWLSHLRALLEGWTKTTAQDIPGGWELKKSTSPNLFRIVRAGDWVVAGCGQDELPLSKAWSRGKIPRDKTSWVSADVDWPRLAQIFPAFAKFDFPKVEMQAVGLDGNLKLTGKFDLSQPLPPLEPWQVPTNLIHPPLTSFTAARGFAPWLTNQPWARQLQLAPEPDQLFSCSLGLSPLQSFIAVPVPNATNALAQLDQNLTANTNWQHHLIYPIGMTQASNVISWLDIPYIQPEVRAWSGASGNFLIADITPVFARRRGPPHGLLQALDQDNLVFYHWEITSDRLTALPQLTQLALMMTNRKQLQPSDAAAQWLNRIGPTLGNCMTEVAQTGPAELTFARTGRVGLTGLELTALANWLEAPNFPGCDLILPPFHPVPHHKHQKKLAAPAPATR